ncbi:HBS1-like protein isoform X2 [Paramacrobiotus metropolitanus]|uniref:HBS1-like protein isoform X2 n=1 Tax=Paramacrobiotus metropolitanus TaxID=2943436 RepID=UPI002445640D|nr:HBS1-like protein isoform X2 [Paramacrobiotus metropolitanus]
MARHRNIRNANYDDYDEIEEFGKSYEDDSCMSPSMAQFIYRREDSGKTLNRPPPVEEEMAMDDEAPVSESSASSGTAINPGKMRSCIDYIESCSGEAYTTDQMQKAVVASNYNAELALQLLLDHEGNVPQNYELPAAFLSKPPLPAIAKKLENLSVSHEESNAPKKLLSKETGVRNVRKVTVAEDPTLVPSGIGYKSALPSVQFPDWISSFVADVNQYNASAAGVLVSKQRPSALSMPRPDSTPDFRSLNLDRSAASTPTPGSPKGSRKGSKGTPIGISPAVTPSPGSPRAQRKGPKDKVSPVKAAEKQEEAAGDGMISKGPEAPNARNAAKVSALYEQRQNESKPLINLVVIGHVDAGKSTLMGHLLFLIGKVDAKQMAKFEHEAKKIGKSSFMYAWVLDETGEERSRGITVDIAHTSFETANRAVNLMDAPGHKDFIPNMITGAAQADVAILVVDAARGGFETGFEAGGQTREHTLLARSLGVTQLIVAINKMDTIDWSKDRFDQIVVILSKFFKSIGFKDGDLFFIPCSGFTGDNLVELPKTKLANWWTGSTLIDQIDKFRPPVRQIDKPYRQIITDVFKSATGGCSVAGKIETGHVQVGDRISVCPAAVAGTVKSIMLDSGACSNAFAGDNAIITLTGVDVLNIHVGDVLCDPVNPVAAATRLRARIALFTPKVPLLAGQECVFHNQSYTESCVIKKILTQINRNTGEVQKKNPRALTKNTSGEVEILLQRPVCAELYSASKELGRFMLRDAGSTIAAGLITEILE